MAMPRPVLVPAQVPVRAGVLVPGPVWTGVMGVAMSGSTVVMTRSRVPNSRQMPGSRVMVGVAMTAAVAMVAVALVAVVVGSAVVAGIGVVIRTAVMVRRGAVRSSR